MKLTHEDIQAAARLLEALPEETMFHIWVGAIRGRLYKMGAPGLASVGGPNAIEVLTAFVRQIEAMDDNKEATR